MTLDTLLGLCGSSSPEDWNLVPSGPGYLDRFISIESRLRDDDPHLTHQLFHEEHHLRAAYKPNLLIGIAWGMYEDSRLPGERPQLYEADWATQFPDPNATLHLVDFFYCGVLVDRQHYVHVDSRCKLPLPESKFSTDDPMNSEITALTITPWQRDFFRVLNAFESMGDYDGYLERAGFQVLPEEL